MKKVWKYIIISLLLLLGLGCVGVLYLFFVPGSSLFNITYINNKIYKTVEQNPASVEQIILNSRAYDVKIVSTTEEKIEVKAYSNSFGFVTVSNNKFDITAELERSVLTVNVIEPYGFATDNASYVELKIPAQKDISITLNNLKAKTLIDDSNIYINNFKYKTKKGDIEIKKGSISGNMNFDLNRAKCTISKDVQTPDQETTKEVNIKLTKGKFLASNSAFSDINILYNERGVITIGECYNIRENQKTAGGSISINKVAHANITAGDTIVKIGEIENSAIMDLKSSGSISIETLKGDSSLSTNSGNIYVGKSTSTISLYSESGNIYLPNAYLAVIVKVGYGEATIKFAEDAANTSENSSSRVLHAIVKNGKLTASGVHKIGTATNDTSEIIDGGVRITGNGRVNLKMDTVIGNNTIKANNGIATVVVNKSSVYTLNTSSQGGKIRVNLTQIPEYNGYTTKEERTTLVNGSSGSDSLTATTKYGYLTVLDTNFA